jgi:hypothetical protein
MLERIGVEVVSIESDNAIIGFRNKADLQSFKSAVDTYEQGPAINPKTNEPYKTTQYDVIENIEAAQMKLWGRSDRIGNRLAGSIGKDGESIVDTDTYFLDVELWHRGTTALARDALDEVKALIGETKERGDRVCDSFSGSLVCLVRVAVSGQTLNQLLDLDIVAELDLPATPVFDSRLVRRVTEREFADPPIPAVGGPSVCVVDSGATSNHPLLANNFGHAESILTASITSADEHGHGTMVGGLAVFGNVRACYSDGSFSSPITLYSARVLNSENAFDNEQLIIHQMRRAIETFFAEPYSCRVFNMSLGRRGSWLKDNNRQSIWAESLDILAREFNVVLVLSAGNHDLGRGYSADEAEEILSDYPEFLFRPECGLSEPATAAIPITVGGIAEYDGTAIKLGQSKDDLSRSVAKPFQPSPLTTIGPGINDAIKPEFVAPAGNLSFQGFGQLRQVQDDNGLSVMSFGHKPIEKLFAFDNGTSFAAPVVARSAAMVWNQIKATIQEDPQANLVRAVLAASATVPSATQELLQDEAGVRQVSGYGLIDDEFASESADRRVTMLHQGSIEIDTFSVFEVPIPEELLNANGAKRIIISLAYDPPVRRRRAEYLGVRMSYTLVRGKSVEEIVEAYRQLTEHESKSFKDSNEKPQGAFKSPFKCDLKPGSQTLRSSTLQKSSWKFTTSKPAYGDRYHLIVRCDRRWAPDTFVSQNFGVTVTLEADEPQLYNLIRNRIRVRQQQRARARS